MHSATIQRYLAELAVTAPIIPISDSPSSLPTEPSVESDKEALPSNFSESINRDAEGVQGMVAGGIEGVKQFVDILEQCRGQILLSGIGKNVTFTSCVCMHVIGDRGHRI